MQHSIRNLMTGLIVFASCVVGSLANAQTPIRHELIRGDLPPGLAAQYYQMNNRSLAGHMQPVQLVGPKGTVIEVSNPEGGFSQARADKVSVGMMIGPVYRFKLSNLPLPNAIGKSLYPSIEVINRLYAPEGLENEFPIQVVLTRDDLVHALEGRLVTRVIYLEDPNGPFPHKHTEGLQPSFDVDGADDPLRAAEKLGRPMAILRMGSRVPAKTDVAYTFNFGAPMPTVLPDPGSVAGQQQPEVVPIASSVAAAAVERRRQKAKIRRTSHVKPIRKRTNKVRIAPPAPSLDEACQPPQTKNK